MAPPKGSPTIAATEVTANGTTTSTTLSCYPVTYFSSNASGRFATAEYGYTGGLQGMLRARSLDLGPWQYNRWCIDESSGAWVLQFVSSSSYFVSEEQNDTGLYQYMLRARATVIGPWEKYMIECEDNFGDYAFKSLENNNWVTTEMGSNYSGSNQWMMRARAGSVGPWEMYYAGPMCPGG